MAPRVGERDVRHIASLARLGLAASQIPQLVHELNSILDHMEALARVDTSGVEAFVAQGLSALPLRDDAGGTSTPLALPLSAIAPALRDGFFLVPRLATHEDSAAPEA